jgi:hypothetical protein
MGLDFSSSSTRRRVISKPEISVSDVPSYPIVEYYSSFADAELDFWNSLACDARALLT